jgi:hypothetical protein
VTTQTSPTISITPGAITSSLDLRRTTALEPHVAVIHDAGLGSLVLVAPPYRMSSGEQLLWDVLAWLSGHGDLPSATDLRAGLDADNYAAVQTVLTGEGVRL